MQAFSMCLIILDIWQGFEYASSIKYSVVLNIPQCSYNNIINVATDVIMLEFSPTRFVYPGVLLLLILYFLNELENMNKES